MTALGTLPRADPDAEGASAAASRPKVTPLRERLERLEGMLRELQTRSGRTHRVTVDTIVFAGLDRNGERVTISTYGRQEPRR